LSKGSTAVLDSALSLSKGSIAVLDCALSPSKGSIAAHHASVGVEVIGFSQPLPN
jgi:hypothetical protein